MCTAWWVCRHTSTPPKKNKQKKTNKQKNQQQKNTEIKLTLCSLVHELGSKHQLTNKIFAVVDVFCWVFLLLLLWMEVVTVCTDYGRLCGYNCCRCRIYPLKCANPSVDNTHPWPVEDYLKVHSFGHGIAQHLPVKYTDTPVCILHIFYFWKGKL